MLKARAITALFLVAGFLAVLFLLPHPAAAAVFLLIAALGAWEWGGLMRAHRPARIVFVASIAIFSAVLWSQRAYGFPAVWLLAALFWLVAVPVWLARRRVPHAWGYLAGGLLLVPTWAALVDLHARSPLLLLSVMALVWVADIAAFFAGRAFGRHKLAPSISPGKTWEGVVGALLGVLVYGFLLRDHLPEARAMEGALLAVVLTSLTAFSVVGDLFESLVKRQAGMKDSGHLLPGHGGILDRIDSQTSTLPIAALGIYWMAS